MAEVDDRLGTVVAQLVHLRIAIIPIIASRPIEDQVERWPVADVGDADHPGELEIVLPLLVVAGGLHFVAPPFPVLDRRVAALDPGSEHEGSITFLAPELASVLLSWRGPPRLVPRGISHRLAIDCAHGQAEQSMADQ